LESAGRVAEAGFEDAREVGELFEAEFERDFLDAIAGEEALIGALQPEVIEPLTDGNIIVGSKVTLDGALGNLAERGEAARAVFRADGKDFPGV
jgi:hypothetical protein